VTETNDKSDSTTVTISESDVPSMPYLLCAIFRSGLNLNFHRNHARVPTPTIELQYPCPFDTI
jgi:hypothetical protein